jgi:hypothetical protein
MDPRSHPLVNQRIQKAGQDTLLHHSLTSSGLMDSQKPVFLECDVQQGVSQGLDQGKSLPGTGKR